MLRREDIPHPDRPRWAPGQVVLSVKSDALLPHLERAEASASLEAFPELVAAPLQRLRRDARIRSVSVVADPERAEIAGGSEATLVHALTESARQSDSADLQGVVVIDVSESADAAALSRDLQTNEAFDFAEPFPARWPAAQKVRFRPLLASDPERNVQWHLRAIRWFEADRPRANDVTVAVLDTGVDARHPALSRAITSYEHFDRSAEDIVGHGTHVSGLIAARAVTTPMRGVTDCRLAVWKVFGDRPYKGEFYIDAKMYLTALRAVERADGIAALNLSIGGYEDSKIERILFRRIMDRGIAVVAAMGNEYEEKNPTEYPAAYDDVIAVGATDELFRRAYFSNTGRHNTISAPGMNVFSTVPLAASRHRWETEATAWDGTSMATPIVTGAIALLHARDGATSVADVTRRLTSAAAKLDEMRGRSRTYAHGHGLLDLRALIGRRK